MGYGVPRATAQGYWTTSAEAFSHMSHRAEATSETLWVGVAYAKIPYIGSIPDRKWYGDTGQRPYAGRTASRTLQGNIPAREWVAELEPRDLAGSIPDRRT